MAEPVQPTVADLGEHRLIERIQQVLPPPPPSVIIGVGDDAAVVVPERGELSVLTTDALVDGVHFDLAFTPPRDIGHRALAVSLSDLAAMGATPQHALLSLALPPRMEVRAVDALVTGIAALAAEHRTALVGGNITRSSGPLFVEVTAVGSVKRRRVLTRSAARAGDAVYVSGSIGGAGAGLRSLQASSTPADTGRADTKAPGAESSTLAIQQRYLRPQPRVRLGSLLGRNRAARACVDLSDGLADAAHQIAAASGVGLVIDADALPVDEGAQRWWAARGVDPMEASLTAGDDYELLFTVPPRARRALTAVSRLVKDLPLTRIGVVTKQRDVLLHRDGRDAALPGGYQHFKELGVRS